MSLQKRNTGIEIKRCSSLIEAVSTGTQLSLLKKEYGMSATVTVLSNLILAFNDNLNISEKMTQEQVMDCAELIIQEYWGYKIEELKIFFRNALTGRYGKVYNRIDIMTIFEMLEKYDNEREQELQRKHQKQKTLVKEPLKGVPMPEEVKDKIKQIGGGPDLKEKFNEEDYRKFKIKELKGESKR